MATVFERIRGLIVEQLGVEEDQVVPKASFVDDLNADSLDLVELIMSMEEEFSQNGTTMEISDEDAEKIMTVQDAVDYLKDLGIADAYLHVTSRRASAHRSTSRARRLGPSHKPPLTVEFLGIGLPELLVILLLILIVVGPNRLPEMAARLARFIRAARRYSSQVTKDFNETVAELEQEYDEMKGEWKEVGQGLDESVKEVSKELAAADKDIKEALDDASAAADEPSKPTTPAK